MHASLNILALTLTFDFDGKLWRALFVAALALIVFVLASYNATLRAYHRRVRLVLIALRGLSLLLVACALAGLHLAYDTVATSHVLLYRHTKQASIDAASGSAKDISRGSNVEDEWLRETADALAEKGIESVSLDRINDAAKMKHADDFSAAVLLTDGATTAEEASRAIRETSAAANGAPVYVVGDFKFDSSQGGRVALQSALPVSGSVWRGVPVSVRCVVHGRGMSGRESLITITDDTEAIRASTKVRWVTNDEWQAVVLRVVPKVSGWTNYAAHIEAAGGGGEDTATLARSFALYAEEHRVRVLFFEGEPTWEAKFIRRALTESGLFDTDYFAQVSRAAAVGIAKDRKNNTADSEDASQKMSGGVSEDQRAAEDVVGSPAASKDAPEAKLHEALSSAARLNVYDCVVVGATPNALLSAAESARLRDWVERRGGGLIVLGGNSFAGSIAAPNGKIYSLLPAAIDSRSLISELQQRAQGVPLEAGEMRGGIALTPTETGAGGALAGYRDAREADDAVSAVRGNAAANRMLLSGEGFRLNALRAGAFALATSGTAGTNGTSDAGAPLIAAMRNGAGRTLLFAPADSWRIRTAAMNSSPQNENGDAFAALWQGLSLWSATGGRASVELALSNNSPGTGSEVTAELRVRDAFFNALKIEKVDAHLQRISEGGEESKSSEENSANTTNETIETMEIAFAPDSEDASLWRARFKAPTRGRFVLEADYTAAGGKKGNASKLFTTVVLPVLEAGAARDALNRVARETGGEVFNRTDARSLAAKLLALPGQGKKVQRVWELRTWWPLAIIISLLLATEWFARRWWQVD